MKLGPVDIATFHDTFSLCAQQLQEAWECAIQPADQNDPCRLIDAMSELTALLRLFEESKAGEISHDEVELARDIHALGEHGLQLLAQLSELAISLGQRDTARDLENLCLPFAVWIARQGGELTYLDPVVNALAYMANYSADPEVMQDLLQQATEIFDSVAPSISEDRDQFDPMRPWRLLLINRAIIATRTLRPRMMEPAFDAVVEFLPADAARFFEEGLVQIEKMGYPEAVRAMVNRYYLATAKPQKLH